MRRWAPLAALVAVSTIVRAWAGLRVPTPWIAADEMVYAELGRSLWETGRLEILGEPAAFYSLLHPALIGLPLALFGPELGYDLARVLQALAMSLVAVPVYLWARRLASERWSLVAAALSLTVPGLAYTGLLMTETLFYPLMAVAAWRAAVAFAEPSPRNDALLAIAAAAALLTRVQAIVLVLVVALAALLMRRGLRTALAVAAVGALFFVGQLAFGEGALGAYQAAGETAYSIGNALKFVVYHAGDAVLLTAVVPLCALALVPRRTDEERAFFAVAVALVIGLVLEVGVFASRYVGRLAERDLLAIAPVALIALCVWLDRGAPRTRLRASVVALAAAGLVFVLPLGRLVHKAAIVDAFTLAPVWEIGSYDAVVFGVVGALVVGFALVPGRWLVAAVALIFVTTSVYASRFVEREASQLKASVIPGESWLDDTADGDVAYFYDGEPHWNAVWEHVFWNERLTKVYDLEDARVPGPLPQQRVEPTVEGLLAEDAPRYVVAPSAFSFNGDPVARMDQTGLTHAALYLWRIDGPLQLLTTTIGRQASGDIYSEAQLIAYACVRAGGTFEATFVAKGAPVTVTVEDETFELAPEEVRDVRVFIPGDDGCVVDVRTSGVVGTTRWEFVRA